MTVYCCNGNPPAPSSRLVRERELKKNRRASQSSENDVVVRTNEMFERSRQGDTVIFGNSYVDPYLEGMGVATGYVNKLDDGHVKHRLLVVANRLPFSATRKGDESWMLERSTGGLVSATLGLKEYETSWIGLAGVDVPDTSGQESLKKALAEKSCIPVFLDEEIVRNYNRYCNKVLLPLFHGVEFSQDDRLTLATTTTWGFQSHFAVYKKVNQMFAQVVSEYYKEGDVVWCHDYHLMFLPKCLKEYNSNMKVGWFLHTPFPSSKISRTLPTRFELLRSVLAADLVG